MRKLTALAVAALTLGAAATASQFLPLSFDRLVAESDSVVRGRVGQVWSQWDDAREVIYTYAEVQVSGYIAGSGSATIVVKEVGGTVGDYTQEAIGFPVLRSGEDVVLFLTTWEDSGHHRIAGYRQGKYLVAKDAAGKVGVVLDPAGQGETPAASWVSAERQDMGELVQMVHAAVRGNQAVSQQ